MEKSKEIVKRNRKPIQYNINSIYDSNGKDIKVLLEEIFKNYCIDEFKKVS